MKEMLAMQFEVSKGVLLKNIEGVTHEESLLTPENGGNCLNWVVGHLISAYSGMTQALGGKPVWDKRTDSRYNRGSAPQAPNEAMPFADLLRTYDKAHGRLLEVLAATPDETLAQAAPSSPVNNPDETIGSLLHIIAFHQAYHTGQAGLLRRITGREGAIK